VRWRPVPGRRARRPDDSCAASSRARAVGSITPSPSSLGVRLRGGSGRCRRSSRPARR
jgi:hypothetical protein